MDFNERLIRLLIGCAVVAGWFLIIPIPDYARLFAIPLARISLGDIAGALFWVIGTFVACDAAFALWYAAITGEKWGER